MVPMDIIESKQKQVHESYFKRSDFNPALFQYHNAVIMSLFFVPGPKMRSLVEGTMAFYEGATKISARCVTAPRLFRGLGHDP